MCYAKDSKDSLNELYERLTASTKELAFAVILCGGHFISLSQYQGDWYLKDSQGAPNGNGPCICKLENKISSGKELGDLLLKVLNVDIEKEVMAIIASYGVKERIDELRRNGPLRRPVNIESKQNPFTFQALRHGWLTNHQIKALDSRYPNGWNLVCSNEQVKKILDHAVTNEAKPVSIPHLSPAESQSFLIPGEEKENEPTMLIMLTRNEVTDVQLKDIANSLQSSAPLPKLSPDFSKQQNKQEEWKRSRSSIPVLSGRQSSSRGVSSGQGL